MFASFILPITSEHLTGTDKDTLTNLALPNCTRCTKRTSTADYTSTGKRFLYEVCAKCRKQQNLQTMSNPVLYSKIEVTSTSCKFNIELWIRLTIDAAQKLSIPYTCV